MGAKNVFSSLSSFCKFNCSVKTHSNSVPNSVFLISFKTEMQRLITKTILQKISTAGTQTKMASLIFKRWTY